MEGEKIWICQTRRFEEHFFRLDRTDNAFQSDKRIHGFRRKNIHKVAQQTRSDESDALMSAQKKVYSLFGIHCGHAMPRTRWLIDRLWFAPENKYTRAERSLGYDTHCGKREQIREFHVPKYDEGAITMAVTATPPKPTSETSTIDVCQNGSWWCFTPTIGRQLSHSVTRHDF